MHSSSLIGVDWLNVRGVVASVFASIAFAVAAVVVVALVKKTMAY